MHHHPPLKIGRYTTIFFHRTYFSILPLPRTPSSPTTATATATACQKKKRNEILEPHRMHMILSEK